MWELLACLLMDICGSGWAMRCLAVSVRHCCSVMQTTTVKLNGLSEIQVAGLSNGSRAWMNEPLSYKLGFILPQFPLVSIHSGLLRSFPFIDREQSLLSRNPQVSSHRAHSREKSLAWFWRLTFSHEEQKRWVQTGRWRERRVSGKIRTITGNRLK